MANEQRREAISELLRRVALGDEEAIAQTAELLEGGTQRDRFLEAVDWFEDEFADVLNHDDGGVGPNARKARAGHLDASLAARHPNMNPYKRLGIVGRQMEEFYSDEAEAGRVVQQMKRDRRARQEGRPVASGESDEVAAWDEDEYAQGNRVAIAQSAVGRMPRQFDPKARGG